MSKRKRTWIVTVLMTLLALGGGIFLWYLPRLRVAWGWDNRPMAKLHVASRTPMVAFETEQSSSPNPEVEYRRFVKTQIAMMLSRQVINSALQRPEIRQLASVKEQDEPIDWLLDHLEVTNPEDTELLEVALAAGSGISAEDQAKLVNAIVHAYLDVVVNGEMIQKKNRLAMLKQLSNTYKDMVKTRRETYTRLAEKSGSGNKSTQVLRAQINAERHHELRPVQIKLQLEQVGTEALLERRKKSQDAATDQGRKEIAKIEDQLVALGAQQKFVQSELSQMEQSKFEVADNTLELQDLQDEIKQMEEASRKINTEFEQLNVELQARSRITLFEEAAPGSTKKGDLPRFMP